MALSEPEADRRRDLTHDKRRTLARAERYRRLSEQYKLMQVNAEMELQAIDTELRSLEALRRAHWKTAA